MTKARIAALATAAALVLPGCEPLLESQASDTPARTTATPTEAAPPPQVTGGTKPEQVSRAGGRQLTPRQVAAMSQARTSVSDGDIMRQLANTAERIAQQRNAAGGAGQAPSNLSPGTNRALGYRLMLEFGWGNDQWPALDALWHRESGWNHLAENRSSGAYGIPQSLPASKMAAVGADWKTNPETQIRWGLAYIGARYGSPQAAWEHSEKVGWY
jgi:hypothetical protein